MDRDHPVDRGMTPIVGNLLLVAVVLVLAVAIVVLSATFLEQTGTPTAEASFDYEQHPAGLKLIPRALGVDTIVKLDGEPVTTIEADQAGRAVLVPTTPGDRLTVVSRAGDRSVLIDKRIDDRREIGDLIAQYDFESGSGTTLVDRSGNDNDGSLVGNPVWRSSSLEFNGTDDAVAVTNLDAPVEFDEFTIAVTYEAQDNSKQELVEHKSGTDNWLLELKPCSHSQSPCTSSGGYQPVYTVDQANGSQTGQIFGDRVEPGTRQTLVGTFDGSEYTLYVDGDAASNGTYTGAISMGDLDIARDFEFDGDYLDGRIAEIRLYYTAFDDEEVAVITDAMD
jgi:flagellin-like protein